MIRGAFVVLAGIGVAVLNGVVYLELKNGASNDDDAEGNADTNPINGSVLGCMIAFLVLMLVTLLWMYVKYSNGVHGRQTWRQHVDGADTILLLICTFGTCIDEAMNMYRATDYTGNANRGLWYAQGVFSILNHVVQLATALAFNPVKFPEPAAEGQITNMPNWSNRHPQTYLNIKYMMALLAWYNFCFFVTDALGETIRESDHNGFPGAVFAFIYPCIINYRLSMAQYWAKKFWKPDLVHLNIDTCKAQLPPPESGAEGEEEPLHGERGVPRYDNGDAVAADGVAAGAGGGIADNGGAAVAAGAHGAVVPNGAAAVAGAAGDVVNH